MHGPAGRPRGNIITVNSQGSYRVTAICQPMVAGHFRHPGDRFCEWLYPARCSVITVSGSTVLIPGQTVTLTGSAPQDGWLWSFPETNDAVDRSIHCRNLYRSRMYNAGSLAFPLPIL